MNELVAVRAQLRQTRTQGSTEELSDGLYTLAWRPSLPLLRPDEASAASAAFGLPQDASCPIWPLAS